MEKNRLSLRFILIYCVINFLPYIFSFFWIVLSGEYQSEFREANLRVLMDYSNVYLVFILFVFLLLTTTVVYYNFLQDKKFRFSSNYTIELNRKRLEYYLIIVICLNMLLLFKTGVGKAGEEYKSTTLSAILALLNFDFFFWIYFINYFHERNKKFYFVCSIFIVLQLVQGWSSFIITFFFVILCQVDTKWQKRLLLILPFIFLVGGLVYTFIYPLKMLVRFGHYYTISYGEGLLYLLERLTKFPNACVAIQNSDKIIDLYGKFNFSNEEVMAFFYPWTPGFLLPYKSQRLFNNLIMLSVYPDYSANVSAGMGVSYIYMLGKLNWFYPILYVIVYVLYFFVIKVMTDELISWKNPAAKYLSFISIFQIVIGYSFRQFGAFVPALWTFIILIFLGCIKVRRA